MAKRETITQPFTKQNRYFSESFKRQKVEQLDKNIITLSELCRDHDVSRTSVYKWIYKYSAMRKKQVKLVIEPLSDSRTIANLKEQLKELERIVGQKQMMIDFQEKMIELAEERYKVDIKKKFGSSRFTGSGTTGNNTLIP
jgi:transposase